MNRFSLSYSELQTEIGKHPKKYAELVALGIVRKKHEAATSGQMPITDDMPEHLEQAAVGARMQKADASYSNRMAQFKRAGI